MRAFPDIGIGIDIESISRFVRDPRVDQQRFFSKIYTKNELEYCLSKGDPAPHLAARFSAKEAVIKALGCLGISGIACSDIDIGLSKSGVPSVRLLNKEFNNLEIKLSMSHCEDKCVACAVIFRDSYGTQEPDQ